jgi:outer membrane protein insertion porin family
MRSVRFSAAFCSIALATELVAQTAVDMPRRPEEKQKEQKAISKQQEKHAQRTSTIEFQGASAFSEKQLRSQLKEQLATVDQYGLTPARADDLAFFLEVFYRKHGYVKVDVHYVIESADRLRLEINEGPLMTLGQVVFDGNAAEPTGKLFDFAVGPTRERYSKLQKNLPFVASDIEEGADLVHRLYIAEGFLDAEVDKPRYVFHDETNQADAIISIHEGRQYFFGNVSFSGRAVYDAETLRGQIVDLLQQPYTDARVADIPRRLQS